MSLWLATALMLPMTAAALDTDAIDAYVTEQMVELGIPGLALAIVQDGSAVHVRGYGETGSGEGVTADTLFRLASSTKPITALAIMQLVEAGKLDLDAPVRDYLPEFGLAEPATIAVRHLLSHTSGLSTASGRRHFLVVNNDPDALHAYLADLRDEKPTAAPGERFQYSNANYQVLALLVETVSGRPFEQYVEEQVLRPLDMHRSTWFREEASRLGSATGHRLWWGFPVAGGDTVETRFGRGSAGLFSSANDLSHFLLAQLDSGHYGDRTVISAESLALQWQRQVEINERVAYGLGWLVHDTADGVVVEHGGDAANFHADLMMLPDKRLGLAVLINANGGAAASRLAQLSANLLKLATGGSTRPIASDRVINSLLVSALLLVPVLAVIAVLSLRRVLRWWRAPQSRPRRWRREWLRAGGFVSLNLAIAAALLIGVPVMYQASLPVVFLFAPDFAWPAAVCGGIAIVASAARLILTGRAYRAFGVGAGDL